MDDEELKTLLGAPQEAEEPRAEETALETAEPEASTEAPAAPGPERGPDGKFVSRAAETPPPTPTAPEPGHVPLSAMLDEREKRQALEKQLAELKSQRDPPPPLEPTQQLEAALYAQNLRASRKFAEKEYGKDTIATVHDWAAARCDTDPAFNAQMRTSDDPYEAAMQAYNREQVLATFKPDDLAAFKAWQAAQAEAQAQAQNPTPSTAPQVPPPRSLATAPGNGAAGKPHVNVGEGQAFLAAIPR